MAIDRVEIIVRGGRGGDGLVSFHRAAHLPRGGPDGGNGGNGGDVILKTSAHLDTLQSLHHGQLYEAASGAAGGGNNRSGHRGRSLTLKLPSGTRVHDLASGLLLKDLDGPDLAVTVARGGRGGRGNRHFASATNRAPRESEAGTPGEERRLRLELAVIADVGLVGMPNAGKSTLLSRISRAHPRIGAWAFTTLTPQLGVVETEDFDRFTAAEIPGLIPGAHQGRGLGREFLRHAGRTRLLLHLVDLDPEAPDPPETACRQLRHEIRQCDPELADKPWVPIGSKLDRPGARRRLKDWARQAGQPILGVSARSGEGLAKLVESIARALAGLEAANLAAKEKRP